MAHQDHFYPRQSPMTALEVILPKSRHGSLKWTKLKRFSLAKCTSTSPSAMTSNSAPKAELQGHTQGTFFKGQRKTAPNTSLQWFPTLHQSGEVLEDNQGGFTKELSSRPGSPPNPTNFGTHTNLGSSTRHWSISCWPFECVALVFFLAFALPLAADICLCSRRHHETG